MQINSVRLDGATVSGPTPIVFGSVTAVTGKMGAGKSSLLHLVHRAREAIAPIGNVQQDLLTFARAEAPGLRVVMTLSFDAEEQSGFGCAASEEVETIVQRGGMPRRDASPGAIAALGTFSTTGRTGFVELVPADRVIRGGYGAGDDQAQRRARASDAPTKYDFVEAFYTDVALQAPSAGRVPPSLLEVNDALDRLGAPCLLDHATRVGSSHVPVFRCGAEMPAGISALSSGCRQLLLFVALRLWLRPRRSVWLVDDLDRDLDHEVAESVLGWLVEGGNQVVFSTRSAPLAKAACVTHVVRL